MNRTVEKWSGLQSGEQILEGDTGQSTGSQGENTITST
jgi:hypothetical protein